MPYQFESYRNPFVSPTVALMLRSGDIQAQRAAQLGQIQAQQAAAQGQIWGGFANSIGQTIGQIPGQIQQARGMEQAQQMNALRLQEAQRHAGGEQAMAGLMGGDQLPQGDDGPRQPSYLSEDGLFDIPKIAQRLGQLGYGDRAGDLVKSAEGMNAQILKARDSEQAAAKERTILFGDAAHGAIQLLQHGAAPDVALDFASQPLLASKLVKPEDFARVRDQILQLPPDQQMQALNNLRDAAAKLTPTKNLSEGQTETDRYGRTIATGAPKKQNEPFTLGPGQIRYDADGNPLAYGSDKTPTAPNAQHTDFLLDGKSVKGSFVPDAQGGRYLYNGQDVTARVKPIPPAAIQVQNAAAGAVQSLPTWATDGSRPDPKAGDANKVDPNVRMTPNGLYQASVNYISTGQYPPTGRGNDAAAQAVRTAINAKAGAIAADSGMDLPALRAFYKSNAASLTQQQKAMDSVQSFMATADRNADLLAPLIAKIPDVNSPLLNKPLRQLDQKALGNVDMSQFNTYIKSVQNEYGRIIAQPNLAGQLTDHARDEAATLLDPNATAAQILGSIQALKNEGNNRLLSIGEQIQRIQQRMNLGNNPAGGPKPTHRYNPATGKVEPIS